MNNRPPSYLDAYSFYKTGNVGSADYTHEVCQVKKKNSKSSNTWIFKSVENENAAFKEVISQEFFRLILPRQPKTRLVKGELDLSSNLATPFKKHNGYGVVSKKIDGFWPFDTPFYVLFISKNIKYQRYSGLGEVAVTAIFLAESDLHSGNIGVDGKYKIVKIDGDKCLSSLEPTQSSYFQIDTTLLEKLPGLEYGHYHGSWFGFKNDSEVPSYPHVRNEINRTILKILILTPNLINKFVDCYKIDNINYVNCVKAELLSRQNYLQKAASDSDSFIAYLKSDQSTIDISDFVIDLKKFQTMKKHFLIDDMTNLENIAHDRLNSLRSMITKDSGVAASFSRP